MFKGVSLKSKLALAFFVTGKLISLPTAFLIISGELDKALLFLCLYIFLIIVSIVLSLIPESGVEKEIPDGVFYSGDNALTVADGKITYLENFKCK
tara:strand:- start:1590 stop:1877 length:288 start_codon:yes stop_codon:yes gene_type:complete